MTLRPEAMIGIRGLTLAVDGALTAAVAVYAGQVALVVMARQGALAAHEIRYWSGVAGLVEVAALVLAAVLFIVWLFIARENAEAATGTVHRRHRLWNVFGWIVPFVNLWFPRQIVDDIWMASHPATPDGGRDPWRDRRPAIALTWWLTWLAANGLEIIAVGSASRLIREAAVPAFPDASATLGGALLLITIADILRVAAGIQLIYIVHKISEFQEARRWRPHRRVHGIEPRRAT